LCLKNHNLGRQLNKDKQKKPTKKKKQKQ